MHAPEQFRTILNSHLPVQAWTEPRLARLPGVQPLALADWIIRDEAFGPQMAYRDWLLARKRETVFAQMEMAEQAAVELLGTIVDACGFERTGFERSGDTVTRPDGVVISLGMDSPLVTAARLVQMDLCVLQENEGEIGLSAGVMCFPSSWTLSEKIGRGLSAIHGPVDEYDDKVANSVNRMLGAIRVEQALWRANFLIYTDPDLHQPRGEGIAKPMAPNAARYVRVERQSFRRLPKSGAVIFGIHSAVVPASALSPRDHAALTRLKPDLIPDGLTQT